MKHEPDNEEDVTRSGKRSAADGAASRTTAGNTPSAIFEEAIAARVFPGGVVWLAQGDDLVLHQAFGTTAYSDPISQPVTTSTIYDVASLTKLFTATACLMAARESGHSIEAPVAEFLPDFNKAPLHAMTVRQLLNHSSGIEIRLQSLVDVPVEEWIVRIAAAPLRAAPGTRVLYTCTAYFLLGRIIELWTQMSLDQWIDNRLLQPLGLMRTYFRPLEHISTQQMAPTEVDVTTGQPWRGVVHDEAARAWESATGTMCGNSGLFSVASDLARFARMWLDGGVYEGRQIIASEDVQRALYDTVPRHNYRQGLGWNIDAAYYMSLAAPPHSAGHPGFTGPTLCINPRTKHVVIILNNRVYPTRDGPYRMDYHRRIAEWLFQQT
jgi:CubicO group peptidase (beta-lactamase class C family)